CRSASSSRRQNALKSGLSKVASRTVEVLQVAGVGTSIMEDLDHPPRDAINARRLRDHTLTCEEPDSGPRQGGVYVRSCTRRPKAHPLPTIEPRQSKVDSRGTTRGNELLILSVPLPVAESGGSTIEQLRD